MPTEDKIPGETMEDLLQEFNTIDLDGNGYLEEYEVQRALEICGYKKATFEVRDLIRQYDVKQQDGRLDFSEFTMLFRELRKQDFALNARSSVKTRSDVEEYGTRSTHASNDIKHSIRAEEQEAFADWINKNLADDPVCSPYLPLHPQGRDLYSKCKDGVILCKVINKSVPLTIDERALNTGDKMSLFKMRENATLVLNSSQAIGCNVVNIGAGDIVDEVEHLILGLLWQILKIGLLGNINLTSHNELASLMAMGEGLEQLQRLSPEQMLLRWVNFHLAKSGSKRQMRNFGEDIKDSEIYAYLLRQIAPADKKNGMHPIDTIMANKVNVQRAEMTLQNAEKLNCRLFVTAKDVAAGNHNLNMAFVANLFKHFPGMESNGIGVSDEEFKRVIQEETREERTYRNWMNSLGVDPSVNYLYSDLCSGIIIFRLYDIIKPGMVDWNRVKLKFNKMSINFEYLENCNYAVELGRECRFSLVGIGGEDLRDGNVTLTLALVWQLMRAYTLSMLSRLARDGRPIEEKQIVEWANSKLSAAGKPESIRNFQDSSLASGIIVLELIEAIRPKTIDRTQIKAGGGKINNLENSRYAITMARKIGAKIYALPEDIAEVKPKMVMTVFACLMLVDHEPRQNNHSEPNKRLSSQNSYKR